MSHHSLKSAVIDVGAYYTKCGFSGEEAPRDVFRSIVGVPRHKGLSATMLLHGSDVVAGSELEEDIGVFSVRRPIEGGKVKDWDSMEELLYYSLYHRLEVEPERTPVLLVSPAHQSRPDREKMAELLLERFNVPLIGFLNSASATVFSTGRTTGLSLDSGADRTTIAAVSDGVVLTQSMLTSPVGGNALTDELFLALQSKGYSLSTEKDWEMVNAAKEKCCRVSTDVPEDMRQLGEVGPRLEDAYSLPDDERLFLFEHQFMVPERLFDPSEFVHPSHRDARPSTPTGYSRSNPACQVKPVGWLPMMDAVVQGSPSILHDDLYGSVVLGGGTSMLRDMEKRLQRELVQRRGNNPPVRCVAFPERASAAWVGSSVWSCGAQFPHTCVTKADYDENGPTVIHRAAF